MIMYRQVLKDKSKIEETVAKLDEFKRDALQKTWEVVNACVPCRLPRRRADPLAVSLVTSLPNCCQGTSPSSSRQKAWTSRRGSRSRYSWGQYGKRV
jgi:hypothetical protein